MTPVRDFLTAEGGASAAEYALILAIVGVAIGLALTALGGAIGNRVNAYSTCLATPSSC
jgi:pilus assembly protein Flp/PilA